jgi:hypothetical protein
MGNEEPITPLPRYFCKNLEVNQGGQAAALSLSHHLDAL